MDTPGDFEWGVEFLFVKIVFLGTSARGHGFYLEETLASSRGVIAGSRSGPGAGLVVLWSGCSREVRVAALGVSGCSLSPLKNQMYLCIIALTWALQSIHVIYCQTLLSAKLTMQLSIVKPCIIVNCMYVCPTACRVHSKYSLACALF